MTTSTPGNTHRRQHQHQVQLIAHPSFDPSNPREQLPVVPKFVNVSIVDKHPYLVVVTLNRPRKRNAMNVQMWKEIGMVFETLGRVLPYKYRNQSYSCRCIILQGAGTSFSAGIDFTETAFLPFHHSNDESTKAVDVAHSAISFLPRLQHMQRCFTVLEQCPIPIVAAIHGNCIGAGIDLVCCCDIRVCTSATTFAIKEVQLGLAADIGTLQRFPKCTGNDSLVRELCLTGRQFTDQEALKVGFVSRILPATGPSSSSSSFPMVALHPSIVELSCQIASHSPVAVMGTKKSLIYSRDHTVAEGLDHIAQHNSMALLSNDLSQAFLAASQKTSPTFANLPPMSRL